MSRMKSDWPSDTRWRAGLDAIQAGRLQYTPEQVAYYDLIADQALAFFDLPVGYVLDVGCGTGWLERRLAVGSKYIGVDVCGPYLKGVWRMNAEALTFGDPMFDAVVCYSVLQHVRFPSVALTEMARVLKSGGVIALLACVDDPNPMFMHQWTAREFEGVLRSFDDMFDAWRTTILDQRHYVTRAVRR